LKNFFANVRDESISNLRINEQIIKPLVDMNYDVTDGKYPQFKFKALTKEEKQAQFDSYINGLNGKAKKR